MKKLGLFEGKTKVWLGAPAILLLLTSFIHSAGAYTSEEEVGFDTLVSDLKRNQSRIRISTRSSDPFEKIKIHAGVALVQSLTRVELDSGSNLQGFHRGVQATLGIDLFSEHWFAEGAIRSFGETTIEDHDLLLREFDLKLIYKSHSRHRIGYRAGIGLAARHLQVTLNGTPEKFSTPATIALLGLDTNFSRSLSIGGEVSYRSAMISESADRNAFDVTVHLDAHF